MILQRDELQNCNSCGFCQTACPVYHATRHEGSTARGHNKHLMMLLDKQTAPEPSTLAHFGECLTCRACTANCPTAMQTDRVVVEGRRRFLPQQQSRLERFIVRNVLANPSNMQRMMSLSKATRPDIFVALVRQFLPPNLERASEMLPRPSGGFLYERIKKLNLAAVEGQEVVYFMSCGMNYMKPESGEATLRVLKALGYRVTVLGNGCCGLPAYISGDVEAATKMAQHNIKALTEHPGPIITDCASCSSFLKEYSRLLGEEANSFSAKIKDFTEFTCEAMQAQSSQRSLNFAPKIVTYHDPCHLSRYQKLREQPRKLLQSIPGLEYRELPEADWCCGGAGTYAIKHPRISQKILDRKMKNVAATKAEILATACPGCLMQLSYGIKRAKLPIQVVHISQLLAKIY